MCSLPPPPPSPPTSLDLEEICRALFTARVLVFYFYTHPRARTRAHACTLLLSYSTTTGILAAEWLTFAGHLPFPL